MAGAKYPPGESVPPPFTKGPGHENLNDRLGYIYSMLGLPADSSLVFVPGTDASPGRWRATASGGSASTLRPLQIINAADANHPGRVRVVNGFLGNLLPGQMSIPDAVLPDGTDNHCYLTMSGGTNYVYGKVLVDATTGLYTAANVYVVTSQEEPDGTYAYLLIGIVNYGGTTLNISQAATGSQQLLVVFSSDGTTINPFWTSSTA